MNIITKKQWIRYLSITIGILSLIFILRLFYLSEHYNSKIPNHWAISDQVNFKPFPIQNNELTQNSKIITINKNWISSIINDPNFYTDNLKYYDEYEKFLSLLNFTIWNRSLQDIIRLRYENKDRLQRTTSPTQKIPRITHCIWISDSKIPNLIPENKVDELFKQLYKFPDSFTHYIWFYNIKSNLNNIEMIKKKNTQNKKIIFLDLLEESVIRYGKDLFDTYYEKDQYSECANIARFNLIFLFGGIYFDFGVLFNFTPEDILWPDYVGFQEGFINSTDVLGAKPRSFVYYALLNLIDNLYRFKNPSILNLQFSNKKVSWNDQGGYTWTMDNFLSPNELYFPLDSKWINKEKSLEPSSNIGKSLQNSEYFFSRNALSSVSYGSFTNPWGGLKYTKYFAKFDGIPIETIKANRVKIEKKFKETLFNDSFSRDIYSEPIIPRVLHKIWITHTREVSQDQLICTFETYQLLKKSYFDWKFIFWTNRIANIPKTISFLRTHCPDMEIREVNEDTDIPYAKFIYKAFFDEGRYANANDILRANIIYKYGGLYIDMGVNFLYDISALMIPFDNIGFFQYNIDSSILGAKADDPLWGDWLRFLDNRDYKKFDKKIFNDVFSQMNITGCYTQMHLLDSRYSDRRVLMFQDGFYVKWNHLNSWYDALSKSKIDLWNL